MADLSRKNAQKPDRLPLSGFWVTEGGWTLCGKCRADMEGSAVLGPRVDFSVMCGNDGLGDRETDAVSVGFRIAGSIGSVETIKHVRQLVLSDLGFGRVERRQIYGVVLFCQIYGDRPVGRGIFQRIILVHEGLRRSHVCALLLPVTDDH